MFPRCLKVFLSRGHQNVGVPSLITSVTDEDDGAEGAVGLVDLCPLAGSKPSKVPPKRMTPNGWPTGWSTGSSVWPSFSLTSSSPGSPSTTLERWRPPVCVWGISMLLIFLSGHDHLLQFGVTSSLPSSSVCDVRAVSCSSVPSWCGVWPPLPQTDLSSYTTASFDHSSWKTRPRLTTWWRTWRTRPLKLQTSSKTKVRKAARTSHTCQHHEILICTHLWSPCPQQREPQQTSCLRRRRVPKQEPWSPHCLGVVFHLLYVRSPYLSLPCGDLQHAVTKNHKPNKSVVTPSFILSWTF